MQAQPVILYERNPSLRSCFPETKSGYNSDKTRESSFRSNTEAEDNIKIDTSHGDISFNGISSHDVFLSIPFGTRSSSFSYLSQLSDGINDAPSEHQERSTQPLSPSRVHSLPGEQTLPEYPRSAGTAGHVMYLAALKGDWRVAGAYLQRNPDLASARITRGLDTALHIAAGANHVLFVEELVKWMKTDEVALQNRVGNTALCFAAASGIKRIAEVMVNKNKDLPLIRGSQGMTPLYMAALFGHREMVWYLFSLTHQHLTERERIGLLIATITSDLFDVALEMIKLHPKLATERDGNGETALHVLARKPSAFFSGTHLGTFQRFIYPYIHVELPRNSHPYMNHRRVASSMNNMKVVQALKAISWTVLKFLGLKTIYEKKLMHLQALELTKQIWSQVLFLDDSKIGYLLRAPSRLIFTAAELGIVEFITLLIRSYPDLIWKVDDQSRSIFHVAVSHRQEKIFNLIYEIGSLKDLIAAYKDDNNSNLLHLAAKIAPLSQLKKDSGAALQLRRELLWFKEVEKIVQPLYREMKNHEGKTPQLLFTEEHKGLVREGEKWMRNTASSCMVVATLIATVVFAAAFTVPGGNNNTTGMPVLLTEKTIKVFIVSDALALFSSVSSILIFLSIITSRYAEEDFLDSLPNKLVMGFVTMFVSIAAMMVAFCASMLVLFDQQNALPAFLIDLAACVPVTLFAFMQFPLLIDLISHRYMSTTIFRCSDHFLY